MPPSIFLFALFAFQCAINSPSPPRFLIEGYSPNNFQNRTLVFIPIQEIQFDTAGYSKAIHSSLRSSIREMENPDGIVQHISQSIFTEMREKIFATEIIYCDSDAGIEDALIHETSPIGWGTPSTDTVLETFSRIDAEALKACGMNPDLALAFNNVTLGVHNREGMDFLWLKGAYMIWDYRINQAVVKGQFGSGSESVVRGRSVYQKNVNDIIKQTVAQILFATPFQK